MIALSQSPLTLQVYSYLFGDSAPFNSDRRLGWEHLVSIGSQGEIAD